MEQALPLTIESPRPLMPTEVDEEAEWVLASQAGDRIAFNRLVLRWQQRVYNLGLRMLGDPEDAAEATQETFLSAYRAIDRFRLDSRFSTWLYRIASNKCLTHLRKRTAGPKVLSEAETEKGVVVQNFVSSDTDQERELLAQEKREQVRRVLGGLPGEQRLVIELKFFQECTFEQIASICDLPLSTIKSRFYSGLQGLKRRLSP